MVRGGKTSRGSSTKVSTFRAADLTGALRWKATSKDPSATRASRSEQGV